MYTLEFLIMQIKPYEVVVIISDFVQIYSIHVLEQPYSNCACSILTVQWVISYGENFRIFHIEEHHTKIENFLAQ